MPYDFLEVGSAPHEEECVQVDSKTDYAPAMKAECARFIAAIKSKLGVPPEGARLYIKGSPHDFGSYYEVAVKFNVDNEEACNYAYAVEEHAPETWDDTAPFDWKAAQKAEA